MRRVLISLASVRSRADSSLPVSRIAMAALVTMADKTALPATVDSRALDRTREAISKDLKVRETTALADNSLIRTKDSREVLRRPSSLSLSFAVRPPRAT